MRRPEGAWAPWHSACGAASAARAAGRALHSRGCPEAPHGRHGCRPEASGKRGCLSGGAHKVPQREGLRHRRASHSSGRRGPARGAGGRGLGGSHPGLGGGAPPSSGHIPGTVLSSSWSCCSRGPPPMPPSASGGFRVCTWGRSPRGGETWLPARRPPGLTDRLSPHSRVRFHPLGSALPPALGSGEARVLVRMKHPQCASCCHRERPLPRELSLPPGCAILGTGGGCRWSVFSIKAFSAGHSQRPAS